MKDNYFKKYQEQDNTCISKLLLTIVVAYQTGKDEVSKAKTTIGQKSIRQNKTINAKWKKPKQLYTYDTIIYNETQRKYSED